MLYLHLVSLESDLFVSESYDTHLPGAQPPAHHQHQPLPGRLHHHLLQLPGPAAVQVRNLWGVVLTWLWHHVLRSVYSFQQCITLQGWLILSTICRMGCMRRRAWTPRRLMMAWWTFLLPRPREGSWGC